MTPSLEPQILPNSPTLLKTSFGKPQAPRHRWRSVRIRLFDADRAVVDMFSVRTVRVFFFFFFFELSVLATPVYAVQLIRCRCHHTK